MLLYRPSLLAETALTGWDCLFISLLDNANIHYDPDWHEASEPYFSRESTYIGASIPKTNDAHCIFLKYLLKNINSQYFRKMYKFPHTSVLFTCFCTIYVFCSPYFDHDANTPTRVSVTRLRGFPSSTSHNGICSCYGSLKCIKILPKSLETPSQNGTPLSKSNPPQQFCLATSQDT